MAYGDFKDLPSRMTSKAFSAAKNPKYDGYQRGLSTCFNGFQIF